MCIYCKYRIICICICKLKNPGKSRTAKPLGAAQTGENSSYSQPRSYASRFPVGPVWRWKVRGPRKKIVAQKYCPLWEVCVGCVWMNACLCILKESIYTPGLHRPFPGRRQVPCEKQLCLVCKDKGKSHWERCLFCSEVLLGKPRKGTVMSWGMWCVRKRVWCDMC